MTRNSLLFAALLLVPAAGFARIDQDVERQFTLSEDTRIRVDISGGPIDVNIVPGTDTAKLVLHQQFRTDDESEVAEILERYEIKAEQSDQTIELSVKPKRRGGLFRNWGGNNQVRFSATVSCPSDVSLDLDTSGGSITVSGFVEGDLRADTSGGNINVTGGSGYLNLDTSGGAIEVDEVQGRVRADTSGGRIVIRYVGPGATRVNADTSGGSIRIGLDPEGSYDLTADTSGGGVSLSDLEISASKMSRNHITGKINGGGTPVRADTSGGSIRIGEAMP